tara:strand:+ start:2043 stop:4781 length:2739 start_codon:yes stop_codon:yes gene_type:complete
MSLLKHISNFLIEKVLPIKFKVWLLDRLACDIASQGEDGDTELAHINSYEAKLLKSVGGSGTINKTTGLRQYGGGGSKGGGGGGGTTTQTVTKEEFPPEIRPYITDILERAQAQEEARQAVGYPVYPGPRIAAFTPEEQAAQAGIVSLVGSQQPTFGIAKGLTAASAMKDTAGAIQERMSPYMQNVVDIQKREAQRDADMRRQQLAAQGVAAGGFGGTREALMQSEFDRNLQQQLGDIQATGQQAAFQQAQQGLANLRQRQMAAGQQMAGLGSAQQATAMKELGALSGVGEQQRQQQQKALDLGFQQFREEQTYPEASLQQYQSIIRGFPISPTTTQTQQAILPQPSLSQQLIGGAGALAGLGIAGQIPKLFAGGGSTFPDLSGDGKITQKDILLGKGVINKKEGKKISKNDNKEYTEMLMAIIEGTQKDKAKEMDDIKDRMMAMAGNESTGLQSVVKLQSGSINPQFTLGTNPGGVRRGFTTTLPPLKEPSFGDSLRQGGLKLGELFGKTKSGLANFLDKLSSNEIIDLATFADIQSADFPNFNEQEFEDKIKKRKEEIAEAKMKADYINALPQYQNNFNPSGDLNKVIKNLNPNVIKSNEENKKEDVPSSTLMTGQQRADKARKEITPEMDAILKEAGDDEVEKDVNFNELSSVVKDNTGASQKESDKITDELMKTDRFRDLIKENEAKVDAILTRREKETDAQFTKRRGFALAEAGFAMMGGMRFADAAKGFIKNLSGIEQDKAEAIAKQEDARLAREDVKISREGAARELDIKEDTAKLSLKKIDESIAANKERIGIARDNLKVTEEKLKILKRGTPITEEEYTAMQETLKDFPIRDMTIDLQPKENEIINKTNKLIREEGYGAMEAFRQVITETLKELDDNDKLQKVEPNAIFKALGIGSGKLKIVE